jgi:Uma2 family endonuclease
MYNKPKEQEPSVANEPDFSYGGIYTYADYLRWTIEERLELIKGRIFRMSAPQRIHQRIVGNIYADIHQFLKGNPCQVFVAPFDVRLYRKSTDDTDIMTVVQPDVCVICDPAKLDRRGCIGAPDIVVEVLSPGNNRKELKNKYEVYEDAGVKEYWIVHPEERTFFRYTLDSNGSFIPSKLYVEQDSITTSILPGFNLLLEETFSGAE